MGGPKHLSREQIARSIVDPAELPPVVGDHLSDCPLCLHRKSKLDEDLIRLGEYAEETVPPHPEHIRFLSKKTRRHRRIRFIPVMAGGLVGAAMMVLILTGSNLFTPRMDGPVMTSGPTEAILELGSSLELEENLWSPFHMYAIGESGSNLDEPRDPDSTGSQIESLELSIKNGGVWC